MSKAQFDEKTSPPLRHLRPFSPSAWLKLTQTEQTESAMDSFCKKNGAFAPPLSAAMGHLTQGQTTKAYKYFHKTLDVIKGAPSHHNEPDAVNALKQMIHVFREHDMNGLLKKASKIASKRYPDQPDFAILEADLLSERGRDRAALSTLKSAYRKDPNNPDIVKTLSHAYLYNDRSESTLDLLQNFMQTHDPDMELTALFDEACLWAGHTPDISRKSAQIIPLKARTAQTKPSGLRGFSAQTASPAL